MNTESIAPHYLTADDGHRIPYWLYEPKGEPVMDLVLVHGVAEYSLRYQPLAIWLAEQGIRVVHYDHRGHGHAPSLGLGRADQHHGWALWQADLHQVINWMRTRRPLVLYGHSLGSLMCQYYLSQGHQVDKLVLTGSFKVSPTLYRHFESICRLLDWLPGNLLDRLLHQLAFWRHNRRLDQPKSPYDWVVKSPQPQAHYLADPLCGFHCYASLWRQVFKGLMHIKYEQWPTTLPVGLFCGREDPVNHYGKGQERLAEHLSQLGLNKVTSHYFVDSRHEVHHDVEADEFRRKLVEFLHFS